MPGLPAASGKARSLRRPRNGIVHRIRGTCTLPTDAGPDETSCHRAETQANHPPGNPGRFTREQAVLSFLHALFRAWVRPRGGIAAFSAPCDVAGDGLACIRIQTEP